MNIIKRFGIIVFALSFIVTFPGCQSSYPATTTGITPIKIAMVGCITGGNAESGRQCTLGAEEAVRYINANGGIKALGGAPIELELIDSTSDPNQSAVIVNNALAGSGVVAIVGNSISAMTLPMLPLLEKYKIPAICVTAANSTITEKGCAYIFQPCHTGKQSSDVQAEFMEYLATKLGKNLTELKIGIVYVDNAWGQDVAAGNRENCANYDLNVVADDAYSVGSLTDADNIVADLKDTGVDAVLLTCYVPETRAILAAMNTMDYNPVIIGSGAGLVWPSLFKDLGNDANGITSTSAWVWDSKFVQENKEFYDNIRTDYETMNGEFMGEQAGVAFACTMMIAVAIENGKSANPIVIRDEIKKLTGGNCSWFALINPDSKFNDAGLNIGAYPIVCQWQDGKPRAVFPADAATSELINPQTLQPFGE